MPTDIKQLSVAEVCARLKAMPMFSESHTEEWRNEVARDLNELKSVAGMSPMATVAVLRIVERVAEFEEIEAKGKPVAEWQVNTLENPFYNQPKCEVMFKDGKTSLLKCPRCARGMFNDVVKWRPIV